MSIQRKIGSIIRNGFDQFEKWRLYSNSREQAQGRLLELNKVKGNTILTPELKNRITRYAETEFGDKRYSSWLELYTELRGEFMEGWIPEDYYAFELIPNFNPQPLSMLSTIKSFDHRLFPKYSLRPLGLKISGSFYTPEMERISYSDFTKILRSFDGEVVIKKDSGPSGKDILFKQASDVAENDFKSGNDYVIQPSVDQHRDIDRLYSQSINTIRIGTFLKSNGDIEVVLSIMRFGQGGSRIDNLVAGGGFFSLDNEGRAGSHAYNYSGTILGEVHPDTGVRFDNLQIPEYDKILYACKESHYLFPYDRYIAWDVCITDKNEIKFLEWNTRMPGFWFYEARLGPLWNRDWF